MDEKNKRLIQGNDIIYPFTKQENVIGLQKTITDKLPIVSETVPEAFVTKQVWIDVSEEEEQYEIPVVEETREFFVQEEESDLVFQLTRAQTTISFEDGTTTEVEESEIPFSIEENDDTITFEESPEELSFEEGENNNGENLG